MASVTRRCGRWLHDHESPIASPRPSHPPLPRTQYDSWLFGFAANAGTDSIILVAGWEDGLLVDYLTGWLVDVLVNWFVRL